MQLTMSWGQETTNLTIEGKVAHAEIKMYRRMSISVNNTMADDLHYHVLLYIATEVKGRTFSYNQH